MTNRSAQSGLRLAASGRFGVRLSPPRLQYGSFRNAIWPILQGQKGGFALQEGLSCSAFSAKNQCFDPISGQKSKPPELHKTATGGIIRTLSAACGCTRRNHVFAPVATHWRKYAILGKVYSRGEAAQSCRRRRQNAPPHRPGSNSRVSVFSLQIHLIYIAATKTASE